MKYQYFVEHLLIVQPFHGLFNTFLWKKIVSEPTFYNVRALKCCRIALRVFTGTDRRNFPAPGREKHTIFQMHTGLWRAGMGAEMESV